MTTTPSFGRNFSGQSVARRKHSKNGGLNIPPDELRLLSKPGQANHDLAIFMARDKMVEKHPKRFQSADDVAALLISENCPPSIMAEFVKLREDILAEL